MLQAEGDAEAQEKQRDMEANVKTNVENAQKKQKLYYNQKHAAGDLFTVGSLGGRISGERGGEVERWTIAGKAHLRSLLCWGKVSTPDPSNAVKTFRLLQPYFGHLSCMPVVYVICYKLQRMLPI